MSLLEEVIEAEARELSKPEYAFGASGMAITGAAIRALIGVLERHRAEDRRRIQLLEEQQAADAAIIRSMEQEIREIGFETGVR